MKLPRAEGPLCATTSASTKPGAAVWIIHNGWKRAPIDRFNQLANNARREARVPFLSVLDGQKGRRKTASQPCRSSATSIRVRFEIQG